jgi:aryl-alcohol dehydrogenase-like predicted oxidoreductase
VHPDAAVQSEWSLFSRDIETTIVPVTRELGIALVPYSPLGRAWLTGAVRSRADIDGQRASDRRFAEENFATNLALAEQVAKIAGEIGARPAQVALAWVLARGEDVVPLPGTRHPVFVRENAGALAVVLTSDQTGRLDDLADRVAGGRSYRPETIGTEAPLPAEPAAWVASDVWSQNP